jgi:hypothetical protein
VEADPPLKAPSPACRRRAHAPAVADHPREDDRSGTAARSFIFGCPDAIGKGEAAEWVKKMPFTISVVLKNEFTSIWPMGTGTLWE